VTAREEEIGIKVGTEVIAGRLITPHPKTPGVLLVHGWGGNQDHYLSHAREIAALGCVCLVFDLRGHAATEPQRLTVRPKDNFDDLVAAYDRLCNNPLVDREAICVVGSSYGGFLASLLTAVRPVRWLALRVPALYKDEHWTEAKAEIDRQELEEFRSEIIPAYRNRALGAASFFAGDVLIVESEHDDFVPHTVITSYRNAFQEASSLTYRIIKGADHSLSSSEPRRAYSAILISWASEMILGAREAGGTNVAVADVQGVPGTLDSSEA
jgi:dienelactone hydrolase